MPEAMKREEILEKPILITGYVVCKSKFKGKYAIVEAKLDNREITFIANQYMLNQLEKIKDFPIIAKVMKRDKGPFFKFIDMRGVL